jgi:alkylhydroperoxidase family enzyme
VPTTRAPLLSAPEAAARADDVGVSRHLAALNVFRVLLRLPQAAEATARLLLELLSGRALPHRVRELVIMRVGWVTGSDYEWTQHWRIAREAFGLTDEDLLDVRDWERSTRWVDAERAALAATDETLADGAMSEATYVRCRGALGTDEAVIELVLAIGAWRTVSELTRSLGVPLEDGVASWPPDGVAPS